MGTSVIVNGARTPMGKFAGALSSLPATELGGIAIRGALERSGIGGDEVDQVILGQVLQAGAGQNPARQAAIAGGIPGTVHSISVNSVCLSGLEAVILADQLIRAGDVKIVVAGGMESMSNAPHLLPGSRGGFKYGDATLVDHLAHDGLHDVLTDQPMGRLTDSADERWPVSRREQDEFAVRSHTRAGAAVAAGLFADEIVPVKITTRSGVTEVTADEGIRPESTVESLGRLRPAFGPNGTITAASSSPISDGAAAVVVMDKDLAISRGIRYLAEIGPNGLVAGPDSTLQMQPANAIAAACRKADIEPTSLDFVEINEAFAAVGVASARELGLDPAKVNVDGGALAIGHPLGMSGARLALHLARTLSRKGSGVGVAALCGGGGQGAALLLKAPSSASV